MMAKEQSSNQVLEKAIIYRDQSILSLDSPEHLERLIQICSDDGMAVLEYKDTGLVTIAEKQEHNFVIWQLTKEGEGAIRQQEDLSS